MVAAVCQVANHCGGAKGRLANARRIAKTMAASARKPVTTQPAAPEIVGDSRDRHVIWQLHLARKHLAAGQAQPAEDVLAQALKTYPSRFAWR